MTTSWKKVDTLNWSGLDLATGLGSDVHLDPYFVWADVTGFADLGGELDDDEWLPVAIEVNKPKTAQAFAEHFDRPDCNGWIWVSPAYRDPPMELRGSRYCTARVKRRFFQEVGASLKDWVGRFELGLPSLSLNEPSRNRWHPPEAVSDANSTANEGDRGESVIVGVIDDGIAFAHERFREPCGLTSRVDYFWNQDDAASENTAQAAEVSCLGYGRETGKIGIDKLLSDHYTFDGGVDEDALYRSAGNRQLARAVRHGTAVMDLACGARPAEAAQAPRIICVQLSKTTVEDASRRSLATNVLDALRFILDRGYRVNMGNRCRLAINFSYAPFGGPHDGTSILERAMDELIKLSNKVGKGTSKLAIVLPAGNGYLERCHASLSVTPGGQGHLVWRTLPDDETPSFLEIWVPAETAPGVSISVTSPWGDRSRPVQAGEVFRWQPAGCPVCVVSYTKVPLASNGRNLVLLAVSPTITSPPGRAAPPGNWEIELENCSETIANIDAWIQRDDSPLGDLSLGRQSRFEDPAYELYDHRGRLRETDNEESCIRRAGTLSGIASGKRTIVIGGYSYESGAVARYSAGGPLRTRDGPDAVAVCERSVAEVGVLAAGTRSGSRMAINGTSVAAPSVTRLIAKHLATDDRWVPDREGVQELAREHDPDSPQGGRLPPLNGRKPKPSKDRGGAGRLPLLKKQEPTRAGDGQ